MLESRESNLQEFDYIREELAEKYNCPPLYYVAGSFNMGHKNLLIYYEYY